LGLRLRKATDLGKLGVGVTFNSPLFFTFLFFIGLPQDDGDSKNRDKTLGEIERIKQKREERRARMETDVILQN